jgi:DNA-binding transcriptional regulator WhiA
MVWRNFMGVTHKYGFIKTIDLSSIEIADIIGMYNKFKTTKPIATKYGYSRSFVENILKRNGVSLIVGKGLSEIDRSNIACLYSKGMTTYTLSNKFNMSRSGIENILKKKGIQLRGSRKFKFNTQYFRNIDCEEKAYWLGFISADGSISSNKKYGHRMSIELSVVDEHHLEKLSSHINFPGKIRRRHKTSFGKNKEFCCLNVSSKTMVLDLIGLGVTPNKSLSLSMPNIPIDLYKHFIRGVVDGDGSIGFNNRNGAILSICSGSLQFLISIKHIFDTYSGFAGGGLYKSLNSNLNTLSYGGNNSAFKIIEWLYKDAVVYLDRKYTRYLEINEILSSKN